MVEVVLHINNEDAKPPSISTKDSVGFDIYLPEDVYLKAGDTRSVDLQVSFDIPKGYYLYVYPRSSTLIKYGILMPTGIIDEDYHDNIHAIMYATRDVKLDKHDRVCQLLLAKNQDMILQGSANVMLKSREGGLGSTGR